VVGAAALTVVNAVQFGLDPLTDFAEAADVGALATDVAATTTEEAAEGAAEEAGAGAGEEAAQSGARFVVDSSGEVTDLSARVLSTGARMGIGAGLGAGANIASGIIQHQSAGKIALDGLIGAAAGTVGGIPGPVASTATGVGTGMAAALGASVATQAVGGGIRSINPLAVGIDTAIGGIVPGAGAVAAAEGVGNTADTIGTDIVGGIATVACAVSGGRC
jgi:hypothetical protein